MIQRRVEYIYNFTLGSSVMILLTVTSVVLSFSDFFELLKNTKILGEYDFFQKKLLNRKESLDRTVFKKTIDILRNNKTQIAIKENPISKINLLTKLKNVFAKKRTFVIADLHLDHTNIIKYCKVRDYFLPQNILFEKPRDLFFLYFKIQ